jgi:hypothetical protein
LADKLAGFISAPDFRIIFELRDTREELFLGEIYSKVCEYVNTVQRKNIKNKKKYFDAFIKSP